MRLTEEQIRDGLTRLTDWELDPAAPAIRRTVRLPDFPAAIALVNEIAQAAEQVDHHPDIDIRYDTLHLALSTHSEGAVTDKDMSLAARVDELVP
ncbi:MULTISPECIES: 4a-hydroxytetrahydrobiopterin dehydratase [Nocardiopsis]|jgi:4a-hydroxytetrahydrobiopterin dehydratase|uniref:Putative pterin-4-alpha-carbinolamine dehydratase n=1 Tax=Nocardiopsis akebiae TaxID=2831968 RepID=A0ABX8BWP2_9ACTN|nr:MULTISPECIES: 4a-hydroxytetrahydrobiopterin dehydratase [Nocardiopsis]MCP3012558.1 4a-hydroxytetrahydrobiopterin dehydratase [Nocardiopsis dassonvillei]QUX26627.1 4a-hydroxytetrahydrobiopterin dehydratase [Nocardiopsis akebiae]WDZ88374.1 4a-hydroxytetrahydrobiopterin dehydratase [Nocardiopsis sp. HUAS JQ3]